MQGLMWHTVIASYDLMKKYITCRHQTKTVVVISFLPVQSSHDKLLYDAELKKYKMKKVTQVGSLRRTTGGQW